VSYRLRKFVRRNRGPVLAAVVIGLAVLAGIAGTTTGLVRALAAERQTGEALDQVTAEQAKTEAALTGTREALDALTDDVVGTMFTRQPELAQTEKAFLRKVLGFYEAFTQQAAETAEARFLRAKGYFKVAHLHGLLGEHREAVAGYREAEALLEELEGEFPGVADYRDKLARTEGNLGLQLAKLGKEAEAETAFRQGITLRAKLVGQFPKELQYRLELAKNYNDLGFLRDLQHKYAEAEKEYRQALDLKETLVAEAGDVPLYHLEWALTRSYMGQLLRKQGKYAESEKVFREALKVQEKQLGKVSPTPRDRQALAFSHVGLGVALAELGRMEESEKSFRRALEVRKRLMDDFPRVLEYRRELANGSNDLAYLLTLQKKDAEAEEPYRQCLELRKKIVADAGPVPRYRQDLAKAYLTLGNVLLVLRRPDEAESPLREGLRLWQQLVVDLPRGPDFRGGLAGTLTDLARLDNQRQEFAAAVALLDKARPHLQAALKARPKHPGYRESYRDYLVALGQGRLGLADHARLATTADELARLGHEPAKDTYDAAGFLGRCATLAGKDAGLDEARRKELARGYAEGALALLRRAVQRGFKDAARMKKDPDLEPLRTRDEFKKLLADLEGKASK
jgi:tetratricopeptide (TPR) repeat protein